MKVVRPTKNPQTQGYSSGHRAYDFAGVSLPDEVRVGQDGEIIERVDEYTTNWIKTGALDTVDYGNYIKIRHIDGTYELHAHLKKGSSLEIGTQVKAGQVVARIGNTGNSTGTHLHSEYRTTGNVNCEVTFIDEPSTTQDRRPYWFDLMNKVIWNKGWEKVTDKEVEDWVKEYPNQRSGNGKWNRIVNKVYGVPTDSNNKEVDPIYEKIRSQGGNWEAYKQKILDFVKSL